MLSKNAKKVLKILKKSENQKISYQDLLSVLSWNIDLVKSACNQLIEEGLAIEKTLLFSPNRPHPAWGVVLTERGRYCWKYTVWNVVVYILKNVILPISVSLLTTLITLLLTGNLNN